MLWSTSTRTPTAASIGSSRHLASDHRNLCVVGDDDQSIYAWRGADVSTSCASSKIGPTPKSSTCRTITAAPARSCRWPIELISYNTVRHDKTLIASRPRGPRPKIEQYQDEIVEAKSVVAEISRLITIQHVQPKDIAILFRTNEQPRLIETELRHAKMPYVILGSQSFFDRKEVRDLIAYIYGSSNRPMKFRFCV